MAFSDKRSKWRVEMDDGTEFTVESDQRDWAAMEALDLPPRAVATLFRALAWSAAHRTGVYKHDWKRFNTTDAVRVHDALGDEALDEAGPEDEEGEQRLNPGRKTPNGTGVSTSRSSRANRTTVRGAS